MEEEKLLGAAASASAGERRSGRQRPPGPMAAPWLVVPYGYRGKNQAFYNICEPKNLNNKNKTYQKKLIPELSRKAYWQKNCHQGWLVVLCDDEDEDEDVDDDDDVDGGLDSSTQKNGDCFLWNPLTFETIQLPSLLECYYIMDCVLSAPPSDHNSMVFFLFREKLVFCCLREENKQWRTKELPSVGEIKSLESLVCFQNINDTKLYIMSAVNNTHLEIEIHHGSNDCINYDDETRLSARLFEVTRPPSLALPVNFYYVESCDELFLVRKYTHRRTYAKEVIAFQVLKMNFSSMAWEEVKDLGDHVLFLSKPTRKCCSAAELGLLRGCIFFTLHRDNSLYQFDMEDGTISVCLPCRNLPTPWFTPYWLLISTTTVDRAADGRREPEDILGKNEKECIIRDEVEEEEEEEKVHKNNWRELNEYAGTWGMLNEDILELIASYLHPVDYLHFRAVCKKNRSAIPTVSWRTSSAEIRQTTYLSPWLVSYNKFDTNYMFINPMHNNEKYLMNLQDSLLLDAEIRFSKGGWLLMSKGQTIFFFNPFTREKIQLPDLPYQLDSTFSGISFSSLPTCSDCVVFAIGHGDRPYQISTFFISRTDDSWRDVIINCTNYLPTLRTKKCMGLYEPCHNNPVFYNGVFYCLDYNGALGAFDLNDGFTWKFLENPQRPCNSIFQSFLVECEGKLLSVFLGHLGKWVRIFRLDFSKMVWVKVESLGRHMLFISNTSCLSAVAPDSHMKNKIYFPRFHGMEEIIFYSLDTGRFHSRASDRHSSQDFYNTKEQLYCSWIEPNWSQTADQELYWRLAHT